MIDKHGREHFELIYAITDKSVSKEELWFNVCIFDLFSELKDSSPTSKKRSKLKSLRSLAVLYQNPKS